MRRRPVGILALLAAAVWSIPALASARTELREIHGPVSPVVTDGERHAAYIEAAGNTVVLDTETGATTSHDTPPTHAECFHNPTRLGAVGGGHLVWQACGGDTLWNHVMDVATGVRTVRGVPRDSQSGFTADAVGRHWIRAFFASRHGYGWSYLNWRTGRRQSADGVSPRLVPSLDREGLWERLCTPLRRLSNSDEDVEDFGGPRWLNFDYQRPYGVTLKRAVRLYRCGRRGYTRLSACRRGCWEPALGGGVVSWKEDEYAYVYVLRSRRRYRWRVPLPRDHYFAVSHTRGWMFASRDRGGAAEEVRVYAAQIPR
jgi:hypothetical protein